MKQDNQFRAVRFVDLCEGQSDGRRGFPNHEGSRNLNNPIGMKDVHTVALSFLSWAICGHPGLAPGDREISESAGDGGAFGKQSVRIEWDEQAGDRFSQGEPRNGSSVG